MSILEARIAESLVDAGLALGYAITVNDGEQTTLRRSTDRATILNHFRTTDQNTMWFTKDGVPIGFIWLIWGNEEDLISDGTARDEIEAIIDEAKYRRRHPSLVAKLKEFPELAQDVTHWRSMKVLTADDLGDYLDACVERERQKGNLI